MTALGDRVGQKYNFKVIDYRLSPDRADEVGAGRPSPDVDLY